MTWFKIDDSFYDHPKVFDAPDCAVALWTRAGTWSARNLTEGFVPAGMPARLCDDPDTAVKELVRRGLWKRASGGWKFHDWDVYQPSKEAVADLRSKRAEAGRLGGQAKAANAKNGNESVTRPVRPTIRTGKVTDSLPPVDIAAASTNGQDAKQISSKPLASASPFAYQNATPTRPVPKGRGGTGDYQGETFVTRASAEPPKTCLEHLNEPNPPPCGACKDARRTFEQHHADRRARLDSAPKCRVPDHRGQLAHNCAMCRSERLALTGRTGAFRIVPRGETA